MTTIEPQPPSISPDEAKAIAQEAWIFGMPLVYIEIEIDTATRVQGDTAQPRSTSSFTIGRFPTPRNGPWSASTSIRSTRWRR